LRTHHDSAHADGTPFSGSPSTPFAHATLGRSIVASALDRIGEAFDDGRTAVAVPPADVDDFAGGLVRVMSDPDLRAGLGTAARVEAFAKDTRREHGGYMTEALSELCGHSQS
jgi:glycosyltransferase involved in cell wall biosynthesis